MGFRTGRETPAHPRHPQPVLHVPQQDLCFCVLAIQFVLLNLINIPPLYVSYLIARRSDGKKANKNKAP